MIKLIMSKKIKSKCKINLLRCRSEGSNGCSICWRQPGVQCSVETYFCPVTRLLSVWGEGGGDCWRLKAGETFCLFESKIIPDLYIYTRTICKYHGNVVTLNLTCSALCLFNIIAKLKVSTIRKSALI